MNKSVYSLVLADEVVQQVDRVAYEMNTSRSNLINQILADYVSYTTPEKRMREVFAEIERMLTGSSRFEVLLQPSDAMFSLRTALAYKYNPNVRYSVELFRGELPVIGELRVSLRSQNSALLLYVLQFFKLWTRVEQSYIGRTEHAIEQNRYLRRLVLRDPETVDNERVGQAIADYIRLLDTAMQRFFALLDDPASAVSQVDALYQNHLRGTNILL